MYIRNTEELLLQMTRCFLLVWISSPCCGDLVPFARTWGTNHYSNQAVRGSGTQHGQETPENVMGITQSRACLSSNHHDSRKDGSDCIFMCVIMKCTQLSSAPITHSSIWNLGLLGQVRWHVAQRRAPPITWKLTTHMKSHCHIRLIREKGLPLSP